MHPVPEPYRTSSVTSADGTIIQYRVVGRGPGAVLIHGGMQSAQSFSKLAEALSDAFTVFVPNRRGRGKSGPFGEGYGLDKEREDLEALLLKTGAQSVFGLSSGALIALYSARKLSGIDKLALYEPPLTTENACPSAWVSRYERELDAGNLAAAMVTAIKGTGDVSALAYVPRFVLVPLFRLAVRADAKAASGDRISIAELIPTLRYDARLVREAESLLDNLGPIRSDVLLLGGDRSAPFLRVALDALATRLPSARRVELKAIGHLAADDSGRPLEVAQLLRELFVAPTAIDQGSA